MTTPIFPRTVFYPLTKPRKILPCPARPQHIGFNKIAGMDATHSNGNSTSWLHVCTVRDAMGEEFDHAADVDIVGTDFAPKACVRHLTSFRLMPEPALGKLLTRRFEIDMAHCGKGLRMNVSSSVTPFRPCDQYQLGSKIEASRLSSNRQPSRSWDTEIKRLQRPDCRVVVPRTPLKPRPITSPSAKRKHRAPNDSRPTACNLGKAHVTKEQAVAAASLTSWARSRQYM